jgi:hypothetical protein
MASMMAAGHSFEDPVIHSPAGGISIEEELSLLDSILLDSLDEFSEVVSSLETDSPMELLNEQPDKAISEQTKKTIDL